MRCAASAGMSFALPCCAQEPCCTLELSGCECCLSVCFAMTAVSVAPHRDDDEHNHIDMGVLPPHNGAAVLPNPASAQHEPE
jgi:hypothetical protein